MTSTRIPSSKKTSARSSGPAGPSYPAPPPHPPTNAPHR